MTNFSVVGNVHHEPANSVGGESGDFDLGAQGAVPGFFQGVVSISSGTPTPLGFGAPLPAKVFAAKVLSGGPVDVALTTAAGTDQAVRFSDEILIKSMADPITGIKLSGIASLLLLVGGG